MVVLFRQLLLPYILSVLRWVPLLEEGGELHCVITGVNSLNSTIQTPIAGEKICEGPLYWIERCTLLVDKDLPPPLPMGSTTSTSESPQLLFWRLSVAFKAATSLAVRDIPGFPLHNYFPITCKVFPITYPITHF